MFRPSVRAMTLLGSALGATAVLWAPLITTPASAHVSTTRELDVTASDYALDLHLKGPVAAGRVKVVLQNHGTANHESALLRLHPGVSVTQFQALLKKAGDGAALSLTDAVGGPAGIPPSGSQTTWQLLSPGNYLAVCEIKGPDGMSHLDMGMLAPFRVVGPMPKPGHAAGQLFPVLPRHTITAANMTFGLPAGFSGHGLYRFVDKDKRDTHEWEFLKMAPGKHKADFLDWMAHPGRPPFVTAGGLAPVLPGHDGQARLDLAPGDYLLVCFVPDDEPPHLPHALMGMVREFVVS